MSLIKISSLNTQQMQGLAALGVVILYSAAVVIVWPNAPTPLLVPLPILASLFLLTTSVTVFYLLKSRDRMEKLDTWVISIGTAFCFFISAGVVLNHFDIYLAVFFWVFLNLAATSLRRPKHSLCMALISFLAYTMAQYLADWTGLPYWWWFLPVMGLGLVLTTYAVLHRNFETRLELNAQQKGIAAATQKLETNEQNLRIYATRLEESNQNLQEFAYVISHDLREPLRTISAYTQLLNRRIQPEFQTQEIKDFMHFIVDAAKRMDGQINGILEYSRVGRDDLNLEKIELNEILKISEANLHAKIEQTEAQIEIIGTLPKLRADRMQLTMLFQNLIGNAIKYQKPEVPPHLKVSTQREGNFWEITVEDNGIGIEPRYLDSIFGVFRRLHTRSDIEGSGIGLSICKRIVHRHGGKIWAESVFGEGSSFHFTLPAD